MRSAVLVAILVTAASLFAGCSGKDEDDHTFACANGTTLDLEKFPDHHNSTFNAASHCTASHTNSTSLPPNKLPVLTLKITDGTNATNVTLLNGNLTFDATGSADPDGQVTGIAVTIQDSNTTRTAALFDPAKKTFKTATFKFDRPGVVNVTVAMVDDRAGFTVNQTKVYVNQLVQSTPQTIQLPDPPAGISDCGGGADQPGVNGDLYEAQFYKEYSFSVVAGVTYVEASDASTDASLTICSPADEPLSNTGNPVATLPDAVLAPPAGIESYYVGATSSAQQTTVGPAILIHYDPRPAA
jgi:major membrane immunogen (membrane-anchored lipoprotein)